MNPEPNLFISFAAGVLSFLSPCILPLIPSYVSYIAGVSTEDGSEGRQAAGRTFLRTVFFVAGFTTVFVVLGAVFTGSGLLFSPASGIITIISGVIVIILGVNVMFDFIRILNIERRFHPGRLPRGFLGSFLMGMAFGGGWTPCVGPILAGILFLAGQSGRLVVGITYLLAYSAGLGFPFLLAGYLLRNASGLFRRLKRSVAFFRTAAGLVLIGIGLLMVLGKLPLFSSLAVRAGTSLAEWNDGHPALLRTVTGVIAVVAAVLAALPLLRTRATEAARGGRFAFRIILTAVLGAAGVLELAGLVDLTGIITSWLTFQGI